MKRRIFNRIMVALALVLTFGLLTGCGGNTGDAQSSEQKTATSEQKAAADDQTTKDETKEQDNNLNQARTIRIGDQANYYTTKIALLKGFFEEEFGTEYVFEDSIFANGPAINESLVTGNLDFAIYADTPAIQGYANDIDIKIISTFWQSYDAYAVVAGPNSGISSVADLKGKRMAFRAGTAGHQLILTILEKNGLSEADVTLVNLNETEGVAALLNGEIDTILAQQPFDTTLETTGGSIVTTNRDYYAQTIYFLARGQFAEENPDTVARIIKVLDKTNKWIEENVDEATTLVAQFNGNTEDVVRKYYDTRDWVIGFDASLFTQLENSVDFAYENGSITTKFDANQLVDTSYLEAAGLYSR